MKTCSRCKSMKAEEAYSPRSDGTGRRRSMCKSCHATATRVWYGRNRSYALNYAKESRKDLSLRRRINDRRNVNRLKHPALELWRLARRRARQKNLPFNIEINDVLIPDYCPVLSIKLVWGQRRRQKDQSPTVDRIRPSDGYIKGNVQVISWRANRLKSDASIEELEKLVDWYSNALTT